MIKRVTDDVQRKIYPQPVGDASPAWLRAASLVQKKYPADMVGVRVKDMPWDAEDAFTNTLASTPVAGIKTLLPNATQQDPYTIQTNPGYGILNRSETLASVIAHELEHIRQNRTGDPITRLKQMFTLPYRQRPDEINAFNVEDQFNTETGIGPKTGPSARDEDRVFPEIQRLLKMNQRNTQK